LTDKVAALEQQVVGTIHEATSAVHETVSTVKSAFKDTVGAVSDSVSSVSQGVKDAFDIRSHIRAHPWSTIAGAALSGFVTGYLSGERTSSGSFSRATNRMNSSFSESRMGGAQKSEGFLDELMHTVRRELKTVTENAVTLLATTVKQNLGSGIQNLVEKGFNAASHRESEGDSGSENRNAFTNGHAQNAH